MTDHRKTAVYIRLSAEDDNVDGRAKKESDSVTSQRILLKSFVIDQLGVDEAGVGIWKFFEGDISIIDISTDAAYPLCARAAGWLVLLRKISRSVLGTLAFDNLMVIGIGHGRI